MIIGKGRDGGTSNWTVRHISLGNMTTKYLEMNSSGGGTYTGSNAAIAPTSTLASVSSDGLNNSMAFVAYCFAAVAGYSAFGSYTGNGSTDGPFVYLGFRPQFVLMKRYDSTGDWQMNDIGRSPTNMADARLWASSSAAESSNTGGNMDYLSNGFKLRNTNSDDNSSGGTYLYMAFAENPFKYANAK
jgi:hypothetical protein